MWPHLKVNKKVVGGRNVVYCGRMKPDLDIFETTDELSAALGARVLAAAAQAVEKRGSFRLAIPGGSVVPMLARGLPQQMNAAAWHIFWVDERCVPLTHSDSNFLLAQAELLPKLAGAKAHPIRGDAAAYENTLRPHLPLDLVVLGMGGDAHVASLFPGHPLLKESARLVAAIADAPKPPAERITLTLPALNGAVEILVVVAGGGKATAVARVFGPSANLPAQRLAPQSGAVRWLVDRAAAAHLGART